MSTQKIVCDAPTTARCLAWAAVSWPGTGAWADPTCTPCLTVGASIVNNQITSGGNPMPNGQANIFDQLGAIMGALSGLATDFTWLQQNWQRELIAVLGLAIIMAGFWVLSSN